MAEYAFMTQISRNFFRIEQIFTTSKIYNPPEYVDLADIIPVPEVGWFYDGADFTELLPAAFTPDHKRITPELFWFGRVTNDERGQIFALAQEDGGGITLTIIQRGRLKAILAFSVANDVPINNPEIVFIFNELETAGAIDPGRAAEILA